jgi:uncharacterized membrane protein
MKTDRLLGLSLLVVAFAVNPWTLGWLFAPDGSLDGEARVRLVYLFDVFCALCGVALLWSRAKLVTNRVAGVAVIAALSAAIVGTWWGLTAYNGAHHHTTDISHLSPPTQEQREWADAFVARAWESARRNGWFSFETAKAQGFELQWGDREHYVKREFVFDDKILDPDRPEFLMYRQTPRGNLLVGIMFFTRTLEERGPQPGGSLAAWHFHPWGTRGYCAEKGILPIGRPDSLGHCAQGEHVTRSAEMLHVWFVDHPLGPFADAMLFPDEASVVDVTLIHPMVVHFAIALLLVAVALDVLGKLTGSERLHSAAFINLSLAGIFSVATIAAGMLAEIRLLIAPDVHQVLDTHKLFGFSACAGVVLLLAWRLAYRGRFPARGGLLYLAMGLLSASLTGAAGYFGSELVYVNGVAVQAIDRHALERLERVAPGWQDDANAPEAAVESHGHGQ